MKVVQNVHELIGNTPIIQLKSSVDSADIYLKLEWFNPGGSVKDRIAKSMLMEAVRNGDLKPGDKLVEPTSGNTGIALAMIAASLGIDTCLVMPESLSEERKKLLRAYGAELILTKKEGGMVEAIKVAEQLEKNRGYYYLKQFDNPANVLAHYLNTSVEILEQIPDINALVAGVGTGGTITGCGQRLKEKGILLVAVEPKNSAVLSGEKAAPHTIQGIGAGFIPSILNMEYIDRIEQVTDEEAVEMARHLAKTQGLLVGISTGANVAAAIKIAKELGPGKKVLTFSPSNGERYLSTQLFNYS